MLHGTPSPRKTLTELLPVTFTIEASAVGSSLAADKEAKRSGIEVPSATKVIAVMMSGTSRTQPKSSARSETHAVSNAMPSNAATKHGHPPPKQTGGQQSEKKSFHGETKTCATRWLTEGLDFPSSSSPSPASMRNASVICAFHSSAPRQRASTPKRRSTRPMNPLGCEPQACNSIVMIAEFSPPSLWGSKLGPPSAFSSKTMNLRLLSRHAFGVICSSSRRSVSPCPKSNVPLASSKSKPGTAVKGSVLQLQLASPRLSARAPCRKTTTSTCCGFPEPGGTRSTGSSNLKTPASSSRASSACWARMPKRRKMPLPAPKSTLYET
mmetsp:Transcript_39057/g.112208  ORF Transcript_39057/g.112208 Transcript_39057/m.112208 type:complete len:325 (-) Transcript_39057:677-1651(-)